MPKDSSNRLSRWWGTAKTWLIPGIGIKRWVVGLVAGTLIIGLGISVWMLDLYRSNPDSLLLSTLALSFIPRPIRIVVLILAGGGLIGTSLWALSATLLTPFSQTGRPMAEVVAGYWRRERGPQVAAIGGGTGLSTVLRGLKEHTTNITAIVTVADDGGSSGRLRRSLGIPPPGDLRNCIAALSDDESLLTQLFQYRFAEGDGIHGHAFGNLFVSALAGVTGSFESGLVEASRVLSIRGRVVPSTLSSVTLEGELVQEKNPTTPLRRVQGESRLQAEPGAIWRIWLEPESPRAFPGAMQALLGAGLIVIGPGSLYTSVLPNLLIPGIRDALQTSKALKIYVCNLVTQPGETDGYSAEAHVEAIIRHVGFDPFDLVLVNTIPETEPPDGCSWVRWLEENATQGKFRMLDLADNRKPGYHDPKKLAGALIGLLQDPTGSQKS